MDPTVLSALNASFAARSGPEAARAAAVAVIARGRADAEVVHRPGAEPAFGPDAPFLIYSLTKTYTAAAALRLVHTDELALDLPIARWLPSAPHASRITLRQLLHHSSGLPDYGGLAAYHDAVRAGGEPWSDAEFLRRTKADALQYGPGDGWGYSNIGYMIVRHLLETVRGESFASVLRAELFDPLRLQRTFVPSDADLPRLTFGPSAYLGGDGEPRSVANHYRLGWIAPGVVASTASEVARVYAALFGGDLLPPALLDQMRSARFFDPIPGRPFARPGYGLGLQVDAGGPCGRVCGHSGLGPGASAAAFHRDDPRDPVTVVVLSDGEDGVQVEETALAGIRALCT